MAKQDVNAERASRFMETIRQQRDQKGEYPLTLARVRELADPQASDEEVFKAIGHKSIAGTVLLAGKKDLACPVALTEDEALLVNCELLLFFALEKLASQEKPLHPVSKIVSKVDKVLQSAFEASLKERLTLDKLPAGIGQQLVKGEPQLFLERCPPPPPPLPKKSPAQELAEQLFATITRKRLEGQTILALAELVNEETKAGLIKKAIEEPTFREHVVVLPVSKTTTLLCHKEDRETVLNGDRLLQELLQAQTTVKKAFIGLADLLAPLQENERETCLRALQQRIAGNDLPAGVLTRADGETVLLGLQSHLSPLEVLRDRVLSVLQERKTAGSGYPLSLETLMTEIADAGQELREKLLSDKTFKSRVLIAAPGKADSPLVLADDAEFLAKSDSLLEYAVGQLSTESVPLHPINKIAAGLDKTLRSAFEVAVNERLAERGIPESLAVHDVKGKPHLRLTRYELPKPPPPAEMVLLRKMGEVLKQARESGQGYPMSLETLLDRVGSKLSDKAARLALNMDSDVLYVALPGVLSSPVVLAGEQDRLATDPHLLESILRIMRTDENQVVALSDVGKRVLPAIYDCFTALVEEQARQGILPDSVGCLLIKKKPYLFLREDVGKPFSVTSITEPASQEQPEGELSDTLDTVPTGVS